MTDNSNTSSGIGFSSILTLIFITLKLTDNIDWSWWWVLMPTIAPIILGAFVFFVALVFSFFDNRRDKSIKDYEERKQIRATKGGFMARMETALREQEAKKKGNV